MNQFILHLLRKNHNANINKYNAMKITQILNHHKTQLALQYYEYTKWNIEVEYLKKLYLKEISWALFIKIIWYYGKKRDNKLLPFFRSFYWTHYIIKYKEDKFDFVNLHKFKEYEDLDISLKTFFNEETNEEIEKEDFISINIVTEVKKRKQKEIDKSFEDIISLLSLIDYTDKIAVIKQKEKQRRNEQDMIEENEEERRKLANAIFRRKTRRKFGCVIIRNEFNNPNDELKDLLFHEEEIANLALIKPKPKQNVKFKSAGHFIKANKYKNELRINMKKGIENAILDMYKANGFLSNYKSKPLTTRRKESQESLRISLEPKNNHTILANDDYYSLRNPTFVSMSRNNKGRTQTDKLPQVNMSSIDLNTIEKKHQFIMTLKKKPHVLQGLLTSSTQYTNNPHKIDKKINHDHQTISDYHYNKDHFRKFLSSKPIRNKILMKTL